MEAGCLPGSLGNDHDRAWRQEEGPYPVAHALEVGSPTNGVKQRKDSRMRLVFSLGALSSGGRDPGRGKGVVMETWKQSTPRFLLQSLREKRPD